MVADELHASPRGQVQRTSLQLDMNSQLRDVRVLADLAHQVTQVTVTGWDFQQGQTISATSQSTDFGQGSGQTGKDWMTQALSSRSEQISRFRETQSIRSAGAGRRGLHATFAAIRGCARMAEGNPIARRHLAHADWTGPSFLE